MPCALCHPDCQEFYLSPSVECWKQKRLHTICKILIWICFLSNSGAKRIWQKLICLYWLFWLMIWWIQKSHADFGTSCIMTQALLAQLCYLYRVTPTTRHMLVTLPSMDWIEQMGLDYRDGKIMVDWQISLASFKLSKIKRVFDHCNYLRFCHTSSPNAYTFRGLAQSGRHYKLLGTDTLGREHNPSP